MPVVPAMQRRHFEFMAEIIRQMPVGRDYVAQHFADELQATNSQFRRDQFLAACKGEEYKAKRRASKPVKPMPEGAMSLKEIHQAKRMVDNTETTRGF